MKQNELKNLYFEWIYQLISTGGAAKRYSYRKLLKRLHETEFTFTNMMDTNREEDGENLRYRFAYEKSYDHRMIADMIDTRPCSVLEMMAALALRCEENIMDDPETGSRIGEWFYGMIFSLGLSSMYDANFDREKVDGIVQRFLNRDYEPNGRGGLFTIENCKEDLRNVEIWCQMCWYLNDIFKEGEQ